MNLEDNGVRIGPLSIYSITHSKRETGRKSSFRGSLEDMAKNCQSGQKNNKGGRKKIFRGEKRLKETGRDRLRKTRKRRQ